MLHVFHETCIWGAVLIVNGKAVTSEHQRFLKTLRSHMSGNSLRSVAAEVGVSAATLSRLLNGNKVAPDAKTLAAICRWMGISPESFGFESTEIVQVHFRAAKNASTGVVAALASAARKIAEEYGEIPVLPLRDHNSPYLPEEPESERLSKTVMEDMAIDFRQRANVEKDAALDSLRIRVTGVEVLFAQGNNLISDEASELLETYSTEWSAMSVPVNGEEDLRWAILMNDTHSIERQRVTYLEEIWHILLGHKLTKIVKNGTVLSRDYEAVEEHDAFYLASATLVPKSLILSEMKHNDFSADQFAGRMGVSKQLVEYRIKRLGHWANYQSLQITFG